MKLWAQRCFLNCELHRLTDIENKLVLASGRMERGSSSIGVGEWKVQTTGYNMGSRMDCITQEIMTIFYDNCKWKITLKNCKIIF